MSINNEFSLFQFDNITHLYLNLNNINDEQKTIEFINKFSNLERLIISTYNIQLVNNIITTFSKLKVELYSRETNSDTDYGHNKCDYNQLNESIDFFHLDSFNSRIDQDDIANHFKRVNSLYLVYYEKSHGFEPHLDKHSDIFTNKSLQHITIEEDCVYANDLINVVKDNDHIQSFQGSIPLFAFGNTDDEDEFSCSECPCYPHEYDGEVYIRDNKLEHWFEFCEHLSTNTTLKRLHLKNICSLESEHKISKEIQQQMSDSFSDALKSNQTLEYLTIPCGILADSFYQRFSEINQTIHDIHFLDVNNKDRELIGDLIMNNKTIKIRI